MNYNLVAILLYLKNHTKNTKSDVDVLNILY